MKRILRLFSLLTIIADSYCQDEMKIWNEFLTLVKNNKMTTDRIRPHAAGPLCRVQKDNVLSG